MLSSKCVALCLALLAGVQAALCYEPADSLPAVAPPASVLLAPDAVDGGALFAPLPELRLSLPRMRPELSADAPAAEPLRLSDMPAVASCRLIGRTPQRLAAIVLDSYTTGLGSRLAMMQMRADPAFSASGAGVIASAYGVRLMATRSVTAMPGLMGVESASLGLQRDFGPVSVLVAGSAMRYGLMPGVTGNFGLDASATWTISPRNSLTLFGSYYSNPDMTGMRGPMGNYIPAMLPAVGGTRVGGYFSHDFSRRFGVSAGMMSEYNSLRRRWETRPIVTPYINVGGQRLGVDVGGILYGIIESVVENHSRKHNSAPAGPPAGMPLRPFFPQPRLK